jgi:hypothetical protein
MWSGVALCILFVLLGVWMLLLGKYITASIEFLPAFYGALFAATARHEWGKQMKQR